MTDEEAIEASRLHAIAFEPLSRGWSAEEIAGLARTPHHMTLFEPPALLIARLGPGEAELLTLAVAPHARREGRAAALLARFETAAAAAGAEAALLEVAEDNAAARTLYTRAGWSEVGRRPSYYRRGARHADALVLRKDL